MLYQITKEAFDKLSEDLQKEYTVSGESVTLKIEGEGAPTAEALTKAQDKLRIEKEHRTKAEKSRDEAEARGEKLREDLDKASGKDEIQRLKTEHQAELEKIRGEREAEKTAAKEAANSAMKKEAAETFANEHFTIPNLMVDQFAKRLSVEEVNGESVVRVLDADGKASALSLNELKQEFLENKEFSPIIKTKAGSGGGANPSGGGGAAQKQLSEMTATEESQFANANPEAYAEMIGQN
jgi:uncharacterized membrane protein YqiK